MGNCCCDATATAPVLSQEGTSTEQEQEQEEKTLDKVFKPEEVVPHNDRAAFESSGGESTTAVVAAAEEALDDCSKQNDELNCLLTQKPYLKKKKNFLFHLVALCQAEIESGHKEAAENALFKLSMELADEEKVIGAAFAKFDSDGDHVLSRGEIKFMLDYLGFPCSDEEVKNLLNTIDTDLNGTVSFEEFMDYVGHHGGSEKLFQVRRSQIEDRQKSSGDLSTMDKETLRLNLMAAGIRDDSQAYWRLTASPSELESAARLDPCQQSAIRHIRALARENHWAALPQLKERVVKLGFTEVDLFMALAWIRELAPIVVHINLDKIGNLLKEDTHYRNQFETNTSSGLLKTEARKKWERGLFGVAYDDATPFERPKYGVQNIVNDHRGVMGCAQYGDSYFVLRDVRLRCTLSPEDSANLPAKRLSVPDFYAHVLAEYHDFELVETLRVAAGGDEKVGNSKAVIRKWGKYKEAQIHGEVSLKKHVQRLVVAERHRPQADWVESIAQTHGWTLTWQNDMKEELEQKAGGREMDPAKWAKKLEKIRAAQEHAQKADEFVMQAMSTAVTRRSTRA